MPADYNIPMTDAQITEALQLMVERVSEGWAQETYDGSPVGSGSPYYHKSSKYWATRSEDAAARAEAAVPAGTAGAVFFDRAQTLTTAQQEQARQNIQAGGSNRNLLDNPWFTVNQRGQSSYSGKVYSFDRWKTYSNTTISKTGNIIKLSNVIQGFNFFQPLREGLADFLPGRKVTFSILFADDSVLSVTDIFPTLSTTPQSIGIIDPQGKNIYVYFASAVSAAGISNPTLQLYSGNYLDMDIKAMKLELGSVSTLANDAPPNYAEELAKCQYYCHVIEDIGYGKLGIAVSATSLRVPIPCVMRAAPSITFTGSFSAIGEGMAIPVSNITVNTKGADVVELNCTVSGATIYGIYSLTMTAGSKIFLSADL